MAARRRAGGRSVGSRQAASRARARAALFQPSTTSGFAANMAGLQRASASTAQANRNRARRQASMHGPRPIPVVHQVVNYMAHGNPTGGLGHTARPIRGGHSRTPNAYPRPRTANEHTLYRLNNMVRRGEMRDYVMPWLQGYRSRNQKFLTKKSGGSRLV